MTDVSKLRIKDQCQHTPLVKGRRHPRPKNHGPDCCRHHRHLLSPVLCGLADGSVFCRAFRNLKSFDKHCRNPRSLRNRSFGKIIFIFCKFTIDIIANRNYNTIKVNQLQSNKSLSAKMRPLVFGAFCVPQKLREIYFPQPADDVTGTQRRYCRDTGFDSRICSLYMYKPGTQSTGFLKIGKRR